MLKDQVRIFHLLHAIRAHVYVYVNHVLEQPAIEPTEPNRDGSLVTRDLDGIQDVWRVATARNPDDDISREHQALELL